MRIIVILFSLLLLSACSMTRSPIAQPRLSSEQQIYRLEAGDRVNVRIYDEPGMSGQFNVDSQGMLAIPLAEKISVSGQSLPEASKSIALALQHGGYLRQPKVSLDLEQARPFFVMGEVEHAGSFPFVPNMTVYQAVATAGGYSYRADRKDIMLRRPTGQGAGSEKRFSANEDTPLLPGDVVEVGERFF